MRQLNGCVIFFFSINRNHMTSFVTVSEKQEFKKAPGSFFIHKITEGTSTFTTHAFGYRFFF